MARTKKKSKNPPKLERKQELKVVLLSVFFDVYANICLILERRMVMMMMQKQETQRNECNVYQVKVKVCRDRCTKEMASSSSSSA